MAMLTMRARSYQAEEEPANFALMAIPSSSSTSDNEVKSCTKACSKSYDELHSQYDKLTIDFCKSQFDVLSYQAALESVEARLVLYKQNESILQENINMLKNEVQARDNVLVSLKQKLNQTETERDALKLKFDKFQLSSRSLTELLANQSNRKHGLGYLSESDSESLSQSSLSDRSQPSGKYHAVPPLITGNFMPPKPDLVFHTAPIAVETTHSAFTVQLSPAKLAQDISHATRPMAPIIEDWFSDSEDESEPNDPDSVSVQPIETKPTPRNSAHRGCNKQYALFTKKYPQKHIVPAAVLTKSKQVSVTAARTYASSTKKYPQKHIVHVAVLTKSKPISVTAARPVNAVVPKIMAAKPIHARSLNTKSNLIIIRHKTRSQSLKTNNSSSKVTAAQAQVGNPHYALKDNGVIDCGCSRHMTGNMSYLSDFQELNGGYVAFGGNPMGGKILGKGKIKIDFKLPNENQVLLRVPRENNRVLVNKPQNKTPYELLHGRTPSIGFIRPFGCPVTILNTLDSLGKFEGNVDKGFLVGYSVNSKAFRVFNGKTGEEARQQYMLFLVWCTGSINLHTKEGDATFDGKEHDAEKPESTVNLSLRNSALLGEQDDMTKKKDKGKSHVDYFTRNRDFNADFEDYSEDSSNDVSAAGPIVPTAGQNYSNSTNSISVVGPLNSNTSPTHGKSSLRDAYQPPDMLEREDIVYSDHENVGAEADFNNLETSITISPILTTRTHRAHLIS
uniref:Ribonuclease H-like domain-containing protein n=1 Tax=Tanacetum cinerariifolium TaxID=118510 RepID=A0A699J2V2_TANCI|nr:ribonuclease H-like domain-containing protein [Tanacetum cinerariifolium]